MARLTDVIGRALKVRQAFEADRLEDALTEVLIEMGLGGNQPRLRRLRRSDRP